MAQLPPPNWRVAATLPWWLVDSLCALHMENNLEQLEAPMLLKGCPSTKNYQKLTASLNNMQSQSNLKCLPNLFSCFQPLFLALLLHQTDTLSSGAVALSRQKFPIWILEPLRSRNRRSGTEQICKPAAILVVNRNKEQKEFKRKHNCSWWSWIFRSWWSWMFCQWVLQLILVKTSYNCTACTSYNIEIFFFHPPKSLEGFKSGNCSGSSCWNLRTKC